MKKITLIALFLLFISTATIYASDSETSTATSRLNKQESIREYQEEVRELRESMRLEIKERSQERKASRAAQLKDFRKERIENFWMLLKNRLTAAIQRLERLIGRIETRITKINEADSDIDVSEAESEITSAKELLVSAQAKLEASDASLDEVLLSSNPKDAFQVVRETVIGIKKDLVEIHRKLVHIIGILKGLRVGTTKVEPSVTVTGTVSPTVAPSETPTATVTPTITE